jgi:hypoxanthine phosphoribosyltransferase
MLCGCYALPNTLNNYTEMPLDKVFLKPLFSSNQIEERVAELAQRISEDFANKIEADGKPLVLLGILKGSFMFLADLARRISIPVAIDFVSLSSYGNRRESSGTVELLLVPSIDLADRHVLVVEDIIDTGRSLSKLLEYLRGLHPKEIGLCVLLDKLEARIIEVPVDYIGFEIPLKYVVGYGLDAAQHYRALDGIFELTETS